MIFWHLFGGGDGANMTTMVNQFAKSSHLSVEATLLPWGNPYYTKLSLAASSGRPSDVAISHLSRLPLLAQAGLLEPVEQAGVADVGITKEKFTTVDGTAYAVPLDTHPWVMFYNIELARKAGLLDESGDGLKPMKGRDDFVEALTAMKKAGGEYGAIAANTTDPATCWRFFYMLYSGLAGPIVSDHGTRVTLDRAAAEEVFAFMQSLTGKLRLMPGNAAPGTVNTLFASGKVGFLFDGVWQIPTYRTVKLPNGKPFPFNVLPFPAILGPKPTAYADSHSLVIPHSSGRSAERAANAVRFIKGLLDESAIWADGGHVPAWLPVQRSAAFRKLKPQSNYVQAAFNAVYDPPAWYTGAGSDFQNAMGGVIGQVLNGSMSPTSAVNSVHSSLAGFASALPPVR